MPIADQDAFPQGIVIFFRQLDSENMVARSLHPAGRSIEIFGEEYIIRDEARYRDDPPPGGPLENIAKAMKIGNAVGRDAKPAQPFKILAAGLPDQ